MSNTYKITNPAINPKRVFILQKSEMEKRLAPFFYIPELLELEKKIKAKKFNKLSQTCEPFKNCSTPKEGNFSNSGVLYYRSQDFDLFELKETQYITEEFNSKIKRSEVKVNDIMLAVVGATLGKIGFINDKKKVATKKLETEAKNKNPKATKKEITAIIQADKTAIQVAFTDKVNLFKEELTEKYFLAKQTTLDNYPIFMAIAEDIGYDATGRNTNNNELVEIGKELQKFITHINTTEK